jgi:hypothetical protein
MDDKKQVNSNNIDIARIAFGAYQSYSDRPAAVNITVYNDGTSVEEIFGQVNPCLYGDQCEGHACYCNNKNAYRKCRNSWYYGEKNKDSECKYYKPNPYWQDGDGDFYEQRNKTLLFLKSQKLLNIEVLHINDLPDNFYKGRKSDLLEVNK